MEIIKKQKVVKEVYEVVEQYNVCDKCGKNLDDKEYEDAFSCEFDYTTGYSYNSEERQTESQTLELCENCGEEAMKILSNNGFKFQTSEGW